MSFSRNISLKRNGKVKNMKGYNINLFSNIIGAIFDKSLTLIIAFFLTKFLTNEDYGLWSQYLQFILICSATLISPIQLFFSREFFKDKTKPLKLYNSSILGVILLFFCLIVFIFYNELLSGFVIVEMLISVILFIAYRLNASYLRFKKKDVLYTKLSLLRFFLFLSVISYFIFFKKNIKYEELVHSFLIAHIPFIFSFKNNLFISLKLDKSNIFEFFRLIIYGIFTSLLSGIDKIIVTKAGYSYEELSYYAYALAIASIPLFFTEGIKQYVQPMLYKDLSNKGDYSKGTIKKIVKFVFVLFLLQMTLPFISYEILKVFKLVNITYINTGEFYWLLSLFSLTFCVHSVYHFVNPYMFFYDKSIYLLILQVCSIFIYTFFVFKNKELNDIDLGIYRLIMFSFVLLGAIIPLINKKIKNLYVYKKL